MGEDCPYKHTTSTALPTAEAEPSVAETRTNTPRDSPNAKATAQAKAQATVAMCKPFEPTPMLAGAHLVTRIRGQRPPSAPLGPSPPLYPWRELPGGDLRMTTLGGSSASPEPPRFVRGGSAPSRSPVYLVGSDPRGFVPRSRLSRIYFFLFLNQKNKCFLHNLY